MRIGFLFTIFPITRLKIQYSIRDIEKLTGIKAHTLRIWEQRFGFVQPHRTDTNIRYYDEQQLKYLLNVSVLIKNGRKISQVARLSPELIHKELLQLGSGTPDKELFFGLQVDALVICMIDLDEDRFEQILSLCTFKYGFEITMVKVVVPFLVRAGTLWAVGEVNVAQEHFISNLVRQKLITAIDGHSGKNKSDKRYLLFLPEGEYHELGLLFAQYLIKTKGYPTVYLGQSLPFGDLVKLAHRYKPQYILTYFTTAMPRVSIPEYLNRMAEQVPASKFLLCGPKVQELIPQPVDKRFVFLREVDDFLNHLNEPL